MTLRAPTMFPMLYPRRTPEQVVTDLQLVDRVMRRWDQRQDTAQIAKELFESEAVVCVALRLGREQRRRERG